jgi:ankyrin repeat protein
MAETDALNGYKLFEGPLLSVSEVINFKNKVQTSPILFASRRNQLEYLKVLISLGGSLDTHCNRLMNPLHYAVLNENRDMIEHIIQCDAESQVLILGEDFKS